MCKYGCSLRSHFCATRWLRTADTFCVSKTRSTWSCSVMGVPVITGSQTVPVTTFLKFTFWKSNKKNHCLDMFFIYQNLYCFKNRQAIIPMTSFSLSDMLFYELWGRFSTIWLGFSIFVLSYGHLAVYLNWATEVCLVAYVGLYLCMRDCVCEYAFLSMCMCDWHDGLYCQLIYPVLQESGKAESQL